MVLLCIYHISRLNFGNGELFLLVLSKAVKGIFMLISLSIQKGKSICVQMRKAKKLAFMVHLLGVCTVQSAWYTLRSP